MSLDLNLTEDEELLQSTALDFLRRDAPKDVVQEMLLTDTGITDELWRKAVDLGWLGIIVPKQYDGTEFPLTSAGVLYEALGTGPLPGPHFSSGILGSLIVMETGSAAQKQQILPAVTKGEQILTLALTEPSASWHPAHVEATAVAKGGDYVLNGTKSFTMDASAATTLVVVARTSNSSNSEQGISLFLVDCDASGVSLRQQPGFLSGRAFEVILDNVKVSGEAMLGEKDNGWLPLSAAMEKAIPILGANKVGGCQAVIDMTLEYSRVRVQFGQPIGRFQRVQDLIIDMVTLTDAARWANYEALWNLDSGHDASESVHLAKSMSSHGYFEVCTLSHRVFSGVSYSRESPVSFHTRTSRSLYHYLGEPSHHRQKIGQLLTA